MPVQDPPVNLNIATTLVILNRTNQHPYLGVLFHYHMSFFPHINNIVNGSVKSLNFVKRNLHNRNEKVKVLGLFHPNLEYAVSLTYKTTY